MRLADPVYVVPYRHWFEFGFCLLRPSLLQGLTQTLQLLDWLALFESLKSEVLDSRIQFPQMHRPKANSYRGATTGIQSPFKPMTREKEDWFSFAVLSLGTLLHAEIAGTPNAPRFRCPLQILRVLQT